MNDSPDRKVMSSASEPGDKEPQKEGSPFDNPAPRLASITLLLIRPPPPTLLCTQQGVNMHVLTDPLILTVLGKHSLEEPLISLRSFSFQSALLKLISNTVLSYNGTTSLDYSFQEVGTYTHATMTLP